MSIDDLKSKLNNTLSRFSNQKESLLVLPQPARLQKQVEAIQKAFDQAACSTPPKDKILEAIQLLEQDGPEALSQREWRYIAWGLCLKFDLRPTKLIMYKTMGRIAIENLERHVQHNPSTSLWWALLFSYFTLDRTELSPPPENWLKLRDILLSSFQKILANNARPKDWLNTIKLNPEILQEKPTRFLSRDLLDGNDWKPKEIAETLGIPPGSWFWDELASEATTIACAFSDSDFIQKIEPLLLLGQKSPHLLSEILVQLLDRYCASVDRSKPHEPLKKLSLELWGSPNLSSTASWFLVKQETKKMVIQWFIKADLEAFFRLLNAKADLNRFKYWSRFLHQMSYTHIILGKSSYESKKQEYSTFRENNKGRFSILTGGPSSNNAFIMCIGNYYIIEFSESGNASYVFNRNPIQSHSQVVNVSALRANDHIERLVHYSPWEANFDAVLARLGIYPDTKNSTKGFTPPVNAFQNKTRDDAIAKAKKIITPSKGRISFSGQAVWVEAYDTPTMKELEALGFTYNHSRNAFWI